MGPFPLLTNGQYWTKVNNNTDETQSALTAKTIANQQNGGKFCNEMFRWTDELFAFLYGFYSSAHFIFLMCDTHFWCDTRPPKIHKYSSLGLQGRHGRGVVSVYGVLGEGRRPRAGDRREDRGRVSSYSLNKDLLHCFCLTFDEEQRWFMTRKWALSRTQATKALMSNCCLELCDCNFMCSYEISSS